MWRFLAPVRFMATIACSLFLSAVFLVGVFDGSWTSFDFAACLLVLVAVPVLARNALSSTAKSVRGHFTSLNKRLLDMAEDFPEDKYDFRLKPEMRTFGAVVVHLASGNIYTAKAGRGENVNREELNPKDYKTEAALVALLKKSIADADATLKSLPDDSFAKTIEPWIGVVEHSAEHYGLLVAYYRANGLVPPVSRPRK
jgi:DinB superfamily